MVDKKSRVFGLDLIRAIAILLVCIIHGREILVPFYPTFPEIWFLDPVDLFFCLSGFLIGSIFLKEFGNNSNLKFNELWYFWIRRWFRTLPNYYFILILNILVYFYLHNNFKILNLWKYFMFIQNFKIVECFHFFTESWSLAIEEWFYISLPLFCYLLSKFLVLNIKKAVLISCLIFIFSFIILRNFVVLNFETMNIKTWIEEFRNVVLFRLDSIVYGVLGGYGYLYFNSFWNKYKLLLLLIGIIGLYSLFNFYSLDTNFKMVNYDILSSVFILMLIPFFSLWNHCRIKIISSLITFISTISYSMYLINASLVLTLINIFNPVKTAYNSIINYFIFWFATIIFSYLNFNYFEKPFTAFREKFKIS